ncbi:MAG TPA: glyoxalase [Candidatus Dormibacteraeota bacterium]|nr:glyoxalase [Candidatus Dormibacteraeota bacterium]
MTNWTQGLHHVQLAMPAGMEDEARKFYVTALDMEEIQKPEGLRARGGVWFRKGPLEIHLGVEDDFRPARKAHPGIRVVDIEAVADRLAASGGVVLWDNNFPGFKRFYSADAFGNRLEFLEPLAGHRAP